MLSSLDSTVLLMISFLFQVCCYYSIFSVTNLFSGSAVAVERIFSGGRDTISLRRASLKPETIRILMLVKRRLILAREKSNFNIFLDLNIVLSQLFVSCLNSTRIYGRIPVFSPVPYR